MHEKKYYPALDGLRGVGFLMVFVAHLSQMFAYPIVFAGKIGVVLFFVLSVFLLTQKYLPSQETKLRLRVWINYLWRRILRIYPLYIVVLVVEIYWQILPGFDLINLVNHLLMKEGEYHFWAIPVEFKYYLAIPLLIWMFVYGFKRNIAVTLLVSFTILVINGLFYDKIYTDIKTGLVNETNIVLYLPPLLIGFLVGVLQNYKNKLMIWLIRYRSVIVTTVVVLIVGKVVISGGEIANFSTYSHKFFLTQLYYALLFGLLIFVLVNQSTDFNWLLEHRVLRFMGKISYAGYLTHFLIINWLASRGYGAIYGSIMALVMTIIISSLGYLFIERPLSNIRYSCYAKFYCSSVALAKSRTSRFGFQPHSKNKVRKVN